MERFDAALRRAGRSLAVLACSREGESIGAVWIAWDEKRAYYLIGGYEHSAKSNKAVSLALWRAIEFTSKKLGLPEFDFEGSAIPAVEQFFRKFGGTLTPHYTVRYSQPLPPPSLRQRVTRKLVRIVRERRLNA